MNPFKDASRYYVEYDLGEIRKDYRPRELALHQKDAVTKLGGWYATRSEAGRGGILVLPTGGGKTFTAVHFACTQPLSDGAKVLWLAHTHHLLEQAFESFAGSAVSVLEPKSQLRIRLISGMGGEHFPIHSVKPTDDVLISSLPTACRGFQQGHPALLSFLEASGGNLLVVFDEAHHAPAPSYRNFLRELRLRYPKVLLLGLTATPTYGDSKSLGWLSELLDSLRIRSDFVDCGDGTQ